MHNRLDNLDRKGVSCFDSEMCARAVAALCYRLPFSFARGRLNHDADREQNIGVDPLLSCSDDQRDIGRAGGFVEREPFARLEFLVGEQGAELVQIGGSEPSAVAITSTASTGIAVAITFSTSVTDSRPGARFRKTCFA
jgi:hypothetical protein